MISALIPPFIKEFLPYISPRAFKVIPIRGVGEQALAISRRLLTGEGVTQLRSQLEPNLSGIRFATAIEVKGLQQEKPLCSLSEASRKLIGERVLKLYFAQLQHSDSLFLDLRSRGFAWSEAQSELLWHPSHLWLRWNPGFRASLLKLYAGFYRHDDALLDRALEELHLVTLGASPQERTRMKDLLRAHFSSGEQHRVRFGIEHLKRSFHEIFGEIEKHGRQLPSDFAFLGIYLTSLYLFLEELDQPLDARVAYLEVMK